MTQQLSDVLARHSLRTTNARRAVFSSLMKANHPIPIQTITSDCPTINRSSIYRVIATFLDTGIIQIVPRGWKLLYELSDQFKPHHHHFTCESCGSITDIAADYIEVAIERVAHEMNISLTSHHIELKGLCSTCRH